MGYEKPRNCTIKLEDIKENTLYSLSLNPSEQHYKKATDRMLYVIGDVLKLFHRDRSCVGHVYVEVSPHGRIHFHGVLGILDRLDFYVNMVPKIEDAYTIEMDTIKDEAIWKDYCQKQQEWMPKGYRTGFNLDYKPSYILPPGSIPKCFQREESQALELN